ncbi:MAG: hypothetical protein LC797_11200 [Chloroflexi bacterium]|nr:hypothetical protein [Chloroflexota bacterium]
MGIDTLGLAVVVLLALGLAVGTWRAWRLRSSWIRWPLVFVCALLTVVGTAVLIWRL